jgi:Phage integrase family
VYRLRRVVLCSVVLLLLVATAFAQTGQFCYIRDRSHSCRMTGCSCPPKIDDQDYAGLPPGRPRSTSTLTGASPIQACSTRNSRHTAAMELLQAGVDHALIAVSLGHESVETTQIYLDAKLALEEEILDKTRPNQSRPVSYRPGDRLLNFLKEL